MLLDKKKHCQKNKFCSNMSNSMIFGGHFENMQIRSLRHHFSACQHWFSDSAYKITHNQGVKPFSSQKCLYLLTFLIFFLTIIYVNKCKAFDNNMFLALSSVMCQKHLIEFCTRVFRLS